MSALLTGLTVGAEAAEEVRTDGATDVLLAAVGAEGAEAAIVMRTRGQLALGVDVEVEALVAVGAVAVAEEEIALGHLAQIVLVQELARLPLLAQSPQPVLTHQRVVTSVPAVRRRRRRPHVPVRALRPQRTVPRHKRLAYRSVRRQSVSVRRTQEWGEGEGVGWGLVRQDLLREVPG